VLTRDPDWQAAGALRAGSVADAVAACGDAPEVWVIGGAEVYRQALPHAVRVVVTEIAQSFEGDAFAPTLGPEWMETAREPHTAANGLPFAFVTFEKRA
jgi:dihydrofolate reductase